MVVFRKVPPHFIFTFTGDLILGLGVIVLATWLTDYFVEVEGPTTLLPSITVFGTVMSLFLAFKTNESYNRWWEARTLWGAMVNNSRSFGRQVMNLITPEIDIDVRSGEEQSQLKKELIYRHIGYINPLRLTLRKQTSWEELDPFVGQQARMKLIKQANIPTQLIFKQAQVLKSIFKDNSNDFRYMQVDHTLNEFYKNSISDTPMTAICRSIEIDLREMLGEKEVPGLVEPVKGVLY